MDFCECLTDSAREVKIWHDSVVSADQDSDSCGNIAIKPDADMASWAVFSSVLHNVQKLWLRV